MRKILFVLLSLPVFCHAQSQYNLYMDSVGTQHISLVKTPVVALYGLNQSLIVTGLGFTPYNGLTNPNGYITGFTLPNVGTAGTYPKVTTDAQGRVTAGTTLSVSDIPLVLAYNTLSKSANYTILSTDFVSGNLKEVVCFVDATSGNVTITMPTVITGALIVVKKIDTSVNTVTISGVTGNNTLLVQNQSRTFDNNSTNWYNQ